MRKTALFITFLLFIFTTNTVNAASSVQSEKGRVYIIQADDWLSKLADRLYGDPLAWPAIWLATNAKAIEGRSIFQTPTTPNCSKAMIFPSTPKLQRVFHTPKNKTIEHSQLLCVC